VAHHAIDKHASNVHKSASADFGCAAQTHSVFKASAFVHFNSVVNERSSSQSDAPLAQAFADPTKKLSLHFGELKAIIHPSRRCFVTRDRQNPRASRQFGDNVGEVVFTLIVGRSQRPQRAPQGHRPAGVDPSVDLSNRLFSWVLRSRCSRISQTLPSSSRRTRPYPVGSA